MAILSGYFEQGEMEWMNMYVCVLGWGRGRHSVITVTGTHPYAYAPSSNVVNTIQTAWQLKMKPSRTYSWLSFRVKY